MKELIYHVKIFVRLLLTAFECVLLTGNVSIDFNPPFAIKLHPKKVMYDRYDYFKRWQRSLKFEPCKARPNSAVKPENIDAVENVIA